MDKLLSYIEGNATAIIVLHEIYGVNDFIKDCCRQYHSEGYDVFCPNLLDEHEPFPYAKAEEAYRTYRDKVGFEVYKKIDLLANTLKPTYAKVMLIGFSVGATLAWRCSQNSIYDGVICCYGSRIRDYLAVKPQCPALLLFATQDSFDVVGTAAKLQNGENVTLQILDGKHGFVDYYSENYNAILAETFYRLRQSFLTGCAK